MADYHQQPAAEIAAFGVLWSSAVDPPRKYDDLARMAGNILLQLGSFCITRNKMGLFIRSGVVILGILWAVNIYSADIHLAESKSGKIYGSVIEGVIEVGDYEKLASLFNDYSYDADPVYLLSNGGDVVEAIKIGTLIRRRNFGTYAPAFRNDNGKGYCSIWASPKNENNCTCASSCFLINVAGVYRSGEYLWVHRHRLDEDSVERLSDSDYTKMYKSTSSLIKDYFHQMGVPQYVYDVMMSVKSTEVEMLDIAITKKFLEGYIPSMEEKLIAKCGALTAKEESLIENIYFLTRNKKALSTEQEAQRQLIEDKTNELFRCEQRELFRIQVASERQFFE